MQITLKVCKLYLLLCLGLSINASPILNKLSATPSDYGGQNYDVSEFEEAKQLSNGYSKSFKKEYSSSSVIGSQPTFVQKPMTLDKYYNSQQAFKNGQSSTYEQSFQNHQEPLLLGNSQNFGVKSNLQTIGGQSLTNVPGVTTTFRDQNGNIVTQVKKETVSNDNGQNAHVTEFEETKQLPNGYSKSFKKEYSSSSVIGSQPTFLQKPMTLDKYYNSEQAFNNGQSSTYGQSFQNHQEPLLSGNSQNFGIKSNLQTIGGQSLTNVPGVTTTFRDQNGNIVTQVKKETVSSDNGQNAHVTEFEETKQLPNGYSKSFKKEYSSSSVIGSQPTFLQKPMTLDKYYNSEQAFNNGQSSTYGQSFQNHQEPLLSGNSQNFGIKSNLQTIGGQSLTNVPGVTTTFRDQNGNIVTQVKKETVSSDNGQNAHVSEFEETKQLPNGYSKSFKKEYSSSSVIGSEPTTFVQKPMTLDKYYNSEQAFNNGQSSTYGQSFQNHQEPLLSGNSQNFGIKSNLQTIAGQSLTNVPGVTTTFRDQNGNIVTQVKKETVSSDNGQNAHVTEFEETKQLPNGYSKSFKKEYSSSSAFGYNPTLITETTTHIPQKATYRETDTFNGYNTFFNNQKYPLNQRGQINSEVVNNKKSVTNEYDINCNNTDSTSLLYQGFKPQTANLNTYPKSSSIDKQSMNINYPSTPKIPNKQQFEKIETFSTQTQEKVGQQSVDLHDFLKPSPIGQQPVDLNYLSTPKTPNTHFEKIKTFSTQTQEEIGQQSVDLHEYLKLSPKGQQQVDLNYLSTTKTPIRQFEKIESFSTQNREEQGQQSVDLHEYSKPSPIGQQPVDLNYLSTPKTPNTHFEKIESFSTQNREEQGQQSVDLHEYSKPSPIGQQPVDLNYLSTPKTPNTQFEKIESFSTQNREEQGQQSVDLHEYSKPSPTGQQQVDFNYLSTPKTPNTQFEKIESFSTQTQEEVGQQSVDLHDFSKPSPTGQQPVDFNYLSTPKTPNRKFEKIESFSTQTQKEVGQQSVDLHDFSKPSPTGQQPVDFNYLSTPKTPNRQFEKIESFSTQTQEEVGQQSVDLHDFAKPSPSEQVNINHFVTPKIPNRQQFKNFESSYQNNYNSGGQNSVNIYENGQSNQQYGEGSPIFTRPTTGQQIEGLESLTSHFGETTHFMDFGAHQGAHEQRQQPTGYSKDTVGQQKINNGKHISQETAVFEKHSTLEKDIDLRNSDHLPTTVDNYQENARENVNTNYQKWNAKSVKVPVSQGQQSIDLTSDFEGHIPTYKKQYNENIDLHTSEFSSHTGQFITGKDQPINSKYNSVFDKLNQLEHEITGPKSTVNINKDNFQTSYSTNHNLKSMPVQTRQEKSHYSSTTDEKTQYIEPESEIISSRSSVKESKSESKSTIQLDSIINQTSIYENYSEQPTTQSTVWRKIGDKFKGSIQNVKDKAQKIASTINDKVGF